MCHKHRGTQRLHCTGTPTKHGELAETRNTCPRRGARPPHLRSWPLQDSLPTPLPPIEACWAPHHRAGEMTKGKGGGEREGGVRQRAAGCRAGVVPLRHPRPRAQPTSTPLDARKHRASSVPRVVGCGYEANHVPVTHRARFRVPGWLAGRGGGGVRFARYTRRGKDRAVETTSNERPVTVASASS